jgi:DmsE family decaheme c-type cytochrome
MENQRMKIAKKIFLVPVLLGVLFFTNSPLGFSQESAGVGSKCAECHDAGVIDTFSNSHHAKAWKDDAAKGCQSCHGSTDAHIAAGGGKETIISFKKGSKNSASEQSAQCLSCHKTTGALAAWDMGKHKKNDISCASCHTMHGGSLKAKPKAATCYTCHKDVAMQVQKNSHHPIREGKVSCSDCHNPHGTMTKANLLADSTNQLCYKCHGDKRGPFIWEHAPVEENCLGCHAPHGSNHPKLLTTKLPNLCQNCHDWSGHPGSAYAQENAFGGGTRQSAKLIARSCTNCHSKIHGSNAPGGANTGSGKFFVR